MAQPARDRRLVIVGDITIGAACLQHSDRITGIAGISFFAVLGIVVALFSTPSVQAVHLTVTGVVLVVLLILLGREQGIAVLVGVGMPKALGEMMVCAGLPVVQFAYWVMRTNADDSLCDPLTGVATGVASSTIWHVSTPSPWCTRSPVRRAA